MIIFKVGDLTVKRLEMSDMSDFFILLAKEEVQKFILDRFESEKAMQEVFAWLISNYVKEHPIRLSYKICLETKLVGCISYGPLPYDESKKEVSYYIDPEYWRRGYATKTVSKFVIWLKEKYKIAELYAETDLKNIGSKRVLEKNEFKELLEFKDNTTNRSKKLYIKRFRV